MIDYISYLIVPLIISAISVLMVCRRNQDLFAVFLSGAAEGLQSAVKLLPVLIALITAVSMFSASGAAGLLSSALSPICSAAGIPSEILPLLLTRPVSGGASNAAAAELFKAVSPDSYPGRCASVIMGSSDTIVYITAVYFSSTNAKHTRHTLPAAFIVMMFCIIFSCFLCRVL